MFFAVLAVAVCSCSGFFEAVGEEIDVTGSVSHELIVLGKQLEDPYTVENMSKAYASLYPTKADRGHITTTDYYVRFLPQSQEQYDQLTDLGVQLMDHPMDFEILKEGDYYHDPEIDEEEITWQYAVVKKDFAFPQGVKYEILDDCFLPENSSTKAGDADWDEVERESFRLTGNEAMLSCGTRAGSDSGTPSGRITIYDDTAGTEIGVMGVRVSCNVFVKFASAYTDESGAYSMTKTFSSSPRYRLVFKNRKGFGIGFNLLLVPASVSTLGRGPSSGLDVKITPASERKLFTRCVVNNAGYEYYKSCDNEGESMSTPPANLRIWLFQKLSASSAVMLQQGALIDNSVLGKYLGVYKTLVKIFLPDITLGLSGLTSYGEIYSAAVHELAHASHYMQVGNDYWDKYIYYILSSFVTSGFVTYGAGTEPDHGYCEVGEMWAYYLQSRMYQDKYGSDKVFGNSFWFSPQILMTLDNKGMNRYKIFKSLTPDVINRNMLQTRLLSLYPQSKSTINQAFGRYN